MRVAALVLAVRDRAGAANGVAAENFKPFTLKTLEGDRALAVAGARRKATLVVVLLPDLSVLQCRVSAGAEDLRAIQGSRSVRWCGST